MAFGRGNGRAGSVGSGDGFQPADTRACAAFEFVGCVGFETACVFFDWRVQEFFGAGPERARKNFALVDGQLVGKKTSRVSSASQRNRLFIRDAAGKRRGEPRLEKNKISGTARSAKAASQARIECDCSRKRNGPDMRCLRDWLGRWRGSCGGCAGGG